MKYQCRSIRRDLQRMRFRVSNQNLHRRWRCQSGRAAAKGRRNFLNELVEFGGIEIADGPEIEAPADQCRTLYPWTVRFVTLACSAPKRCATSRLMTCLRRLYTTEATGSPSM